MKAFRCLAALITLLMVTAACSDGTSVFELRVGDCFDDPGEEIINEIETIACSNPHDFEVFFIGDLDHQGTYPGDAEIVAMAQELCLPQFTPYVGSDFLSSALDVSALYPSLSSWTDLNDREVVCVVYDYQLQKLTGTARDSGW